MAVKLTTAEFIAKATAKHGTTYDYSKVSYDGNRNKVIIICSIHGEFSQLAGNHINSSRRNGCPKCSESAAKTTAQFIADSIHTHGTKYDYSKVNYTTAMTPVTIICKEHGEFQQQPNIHIRGSNCPRCASLLNMLQWRPEPTLLYYIFFPFLQVYKIGITLERIGVHRRYAAEPQSFIILHTVLFSSGKDAYEREQQLLKENTAHRLPYTNLLVSGNTELFSKNILKDIK